MTLQYFRGERDYLHSTTMLHFIHHELAIEDDHCKNIDFSCRRFSDKVVYLSNFNDVSVDDSRIVGEYRDTNHHVHIMESDEPLSKRYVYNEEDITSRCLIEDGSLFIPDVIPGFTMFECIIAGYKMLLKKLFRQQSGSFFFIRAQLNEIPKKAVKITFNRLISKIYYQSSVFCEERKIGMVIYGRKE
jgi:hypothetical protein